MFVDSVLYISGFHANSGPHAWPPINTPVLSCDHRIPQIVQTTSTARDVHRFDKEHATRGCCFMTCNRFDDFTIGSWWTAMNEAGKTCEEEEDNSLYGKYHCPVPNFTAGYILAPYRLPTGSFKGSLLFSSRSDKRASPHEYTILCTLKI